MMSAFILFFLQDVDEDGNAYLVFDLCAGDKPYYELLHFNNLASEDAQLPVTDAVRADRKPRPVRRCAAV